MITQSIGQLAAALNGDDGTTGESETVSKKASWLGLWSSNKSSKTSDVGSGD
jgi:hypothetical protein